MSQAADMNAFLTNVEKRAFNLARLAVGDTDDALDIVQDSMLALATRYGNKPATEWQPLFFRILNNRINDHHRRQTLKRRFFGWLVQPEDNGDAMANVSADGTEEPDRLAESSAQMAALSDAIPNLPARQQQAFIWCTLEGMSIGEAARCMGCSAGSVKTHHHRALNALRERLQEAEG